MRVGDRVRADEKAMRHSCEHVPDDPAGQIVGEYDEFWVVRFDEDAADDALFLEAELRPLIEPLDMP